MIIDTKAIDAYRQGVEITQFKDYDAGIVKIHAGEIGHILKRNRAGEDRHYRVDSTYLDSSFVDPVARVKGNDNSTIINTDFVDGRTEDGIIEPLTIRSISRREKLLSSYEPHQFYGSMMGGSEIEHCSAAPIVTVDYFNNLNPGTPFSDCIEYFYDIPMRHVLMSGSKLSPYVDIENELESTAYNAKGWRSADNQEKFLVQLKGMAGTRDNGYVSLRQVSATAGWVYDGSVGTDSIAFGGMGY